jgi:uncharacterized protein (TIGR00369 family)
MAGMSCKAIEAWFRSHWPEFSETITLEEAGDGRARIRLSVGRRHLRPGETVSGPTMMTLADTALYAALLATDGQATDAVTSQFNISFLRRPPRQDLLAAAELLKAGRRLVVGEVRILGGDGSLVAHATVTYARP